MIMMVSGDPMFFGENNSEISFPIDLKCSGKM